MAETVNQETNGTAAETQENEQRTFTQAEMNAIIQDRLTRERGKYADYEALKAKAAKFDEAEEAGKTDLQKAQSCRDFRAGSAPFYFQKNSTPGRRMGDRRALDRFTIELYKTAKEMSIENSKKCGYFSCF